MTTSPIPIELAGITLDIAEPEAYLDVLFRVLEQRYPDRPALLAQVGASLGRAPTDTPLEPSVVGRQIGYCGPIVNGLIDHEWHEQPRNECDELVSYLQSRPLLDTARSIFLWGAGTCRLGDYFASLPGVGEVTCSDLSWLALHFGRTLIRGELLDLPEAVLRPRTFYHADAARRSLLTTSRPSHFKRPYTDVEQQRKLRYAVRDMFCDNSPLTAELLVAPYALDNFDGARLVTALIRLCQQVRVGQTLLVITSIAARLDGSEARSPQRIVETVQGCGLRTAFVELTELPYSFVYHGFAQYRATYNTLVLLAARNEPLDPAALVVKSAAARRDAAPPAADQSLLLSQCEPRLAYSELYQRAAAQLTPQRFERALGALSAAGLLELGLRDGADFGETK